MKLRFRILLSCIVCVLLALLIQTFLFKETSSEMIYNLSREDFYRKAYEVGAGNFETSDKVMALYLYTMDHEIISTYRKATTPKHNYPVDIYEDMETYNAKKVQDYVESDEQALLISGYYNAYREKDIIRFVLKLYNNSNRNKKIGYVVCDVDSKVFTDILEKYCTENTMYIWLQSDSDRPIVPQGSLAEVDDGIYQVISGQIEAGDQASIANQSKQELFQAEQRKYNLTAYSLMPESILLQNQRAPERFHVEHSYFSRVFRQEIGESPVLYITNRRMEKAKQYIQEGKKNLTEVAFMVGYDDYTYFSRVFRKNAGMSPREYRSRFLG